MSHCKNQLSRKNSVMQEIRDKKVIRHLANNKMTSFFSRNCPKWKTKCENGQKTEPNCCLGEPTEEGDAAQVGPGEVCDRQKHKDLGINEVRWAVVQGGQSVRTHWDRIGSQTWETLRTLWELGVLISKLRMRKLSLGEVEFFSCTWFPNPSTHTDSESDSPPYKHLLKTWLQHT